MGPAQRWAKLLYRFQIIAAEFVAAAEYAKIILKALFLARPRVDGLWEGAA